MPSLLSGSTLRRGGSGEFIDLAGAQPQLPATETTLTGFTVATNEFLQTTYRSSLGFVEFTTASMYSALPEGTVRVLSTGASFLSTTTQSGTLVVEGGIGVGGNMTIEYDIEVNGVTIGRGWEGQHNIIMRGISEPPIDDFLNGQSSIAIGDGSLLGLDTANRVIAIGRNAISSGTKVSKTIAIGDSALNDIGTLDNIFIGNITSATQTSPIIITVIGHNISTGTHVVINDVVGMIELNQAEFWVDKITDDELALYVDNIVSSPADGTGYTAFVSGGELGRVLSRNNNIAIGNDAARKLIDGNKNFFFGDSIAKNLTTGSYNIFVGSDVANNLTEAHGIISIGSDNLVEGLDNQVAIGSVFYYNGTGTGSLNANFEIGLGTQSTSTNTGGLTVIGGAGIQRNLYVGEELNVGTTSTFNSDVLPGNSNVSLGSTSSPFKSLFLQGSTLYLSTVTLKSEDSQSFSVESPAGAVRQTVGNLTLNSGQESSGFANGSLIVSGGAGIAGNVNINGQLNVLGSGDVNLSPENGDVYIQPTLGGTLLIEPAITGNLDNVIIGANNPADGTFDSIAGNNANITGLTASTSTTTGAVTIAGGVGIKGDVYSATGNPDENFLLYTPRVTVQLSSPPVDPRVGDIWIDPTIPAYLQYIKDGTSTFWIQVGSV